MLMWALNFVLAFFLLNNCDFSLARTLDDIDSNRIDETDFEIFKLAQQWPQITCLDLNGKWSDLEHHCSSCKMPRNKVRWTLHGLWPSNTDKHNSPSFCNRQGKVQFDKLPSELRRNLEEKWPTFKLNNHNEDFWRHEFQKHGSCALQNPQVNTMEKYIYKSLELLDEYNVGQILQSNGITPGRSYTFRDMYNALEKSLGVNVCVECRTPPNSDCQYLTQVYMNFDQSFNLVDCATGNRGPGNCQFKKETCYPEMMKTCH